MKLKLAAYALLVALVIWFGLELRSDYSSIGEAVGGSITNTAAGTAARPKHGKTNLVVPPPEEAMATNESTNSLAETNTPAGANMVEQTVAPQALSSNTADSNSTAAALPATGPAPVATTAGRAVRHLAALVGAVVLLGLMVTYDLTHFMGARAINYLFDDLGEGARDPEYERAEQTWVNGQHLEAIEMMREYLRKNPRDQFVALRIAEIYEKDLNNLVAASLEYEEILKKRLPDERWGRAAIHLCNIYSRMGQQDKMRALLERIAKDYPKTAAAKKARRNLGLPEPQGEEAPPAAPPPEPVEEQDENAGQVFNLDEMIAASDEETASQPPEATPETPPPAAPPKSKLPPGFRKKE